MSIAFHDIRYAGGNKYKKGYSFTPDQLGMQEVGTQTLLLQGTDRRIDGMVEDIDGNLWICGYSTSTGRAYMEKKKYSVSSGVATYSTVLSVTPSSGYPTGLMVVPGKPDIYMNDGSFKRYNKDTGTLLSTASSTVGGQLSFSKAIPSPDGNYIYGYDPAGSRFYVLNLDLTIARTFQTLPPFGNNRHVIVDNRYLIISNYNGSNPNFPYQNILYNIATGAMTRHPSQNQFENVESGATTWVNNGFIYITVGSKILKHRISDMFLEAVYTPGGTNTNVRVSNILDYDKDYVTVFYQEFSSMRRILRLLKKSDFITFADLPYIVSLPPSMNILNISQDNTIFKYAEYETTGWSIKMTQSKFTIQ